MKDHIYADMELNGYRQCRASEAESDMQNYETKGGVKQWEKSPTKEKLWRRSGIAACSLAAYTKSCYMPFFLLLTIFVSIPSIHQNWKLNFCSLQFY